MATEETETMPTEAIPCWTMPCGFVGKDEPDEKRNGTMHTRLDGSRGEDKCGFRLSTLRL